MNLAGTVNRFLAAVVLVLGLVTALPSTAADATGAQTTDRLVLVGGATGRTGRLVAQLLVHAGFRVRGITRDTDAAKHDFGTSIEWVKADVRDPESLRAAFTGVSYVINAVGTESFAGENGPEQVNYAGMKNLVDAAKAAGAEYFGLVSAGGVENAKAYIAKGLRDGATWRFKGEEYLRSSGLKYTIVRAGGLRDFPGGENGILLLQKDDVAPGLITRADVAAVIVECLNNPDAVNKTFAILNYLAIDPEGWRKSLAALKRD
jgi:uncharacterized protein YbjT (DUF2867 family)